MINETLRANGIAKIQSYVTQNTDLLDDPIFSSESFKNNCAEYYLYYPYLFSNSFDNIGSSQLENLNLASYFCYRYVVLKNDIIDNQVSSNLVDEYEKMSTCYMNHALKILRVLFEEKSIFWQKWMIRKDELQKSVILDKTLNLDNYTEEIFKEYAWNKSGFAKLAIDALFVLSGQHDINIYQSLLNSHKEFSCAMQIYDDLFDVVEDQTNPQFNFAINQIIIEFLKIGLNKNSLTKEDIENYFFASGKGVEVLSIALRYILNAKEFSRPSTNIAWNNILLFYEKLFIVTRRSIDTYIKKIYAEKLNSNIPFLQATPNVSVLELNKSLKIGLKFIYDRSNDNGSWNEYLTSAGSSDVWATGFISFFTADFLDSKRKYRAKSFIAKSASPYWGYRQAYVNDIDSTNFALLVLRSDSKFIHFVDFLYKWQNIDGGIPTYPSVCIGMLRKAMKASDNDSYIGWTQSHPCVASVSFYVLNTVRHDVNNTKVLELEKYFLIFFQSGEKLAYWWTNEIYTLYFLVLSYEFIQSIELKRMLLNRLNKIFMSIDDEGCIGDAFNNKSPFYTSLLILILLELNRMSIIDFKVDIDNSILWLLKNQLKDGSWKETNALQIPEPFCIIPDNKNWEVSEYGCNIRASEFNRLFATSVCLKAIYEFKKSK